MTRRRRWCAGLALALLAAPAAAKGPAPRAQEEKGTYLGVLFAPVPEALYDQLPQLPRQQGVLVTHVLPDSPAASAGLRRHDVLLHYDGERIRDCEHFARLIQADRPERKVRLGLMRGGRAETVEATLALGPVLRIAAAGGAGAPRGAAVPRAVNKPGGPPPVSVAATPLEHGRLKVSVEYVPEREGRPRTL